MEILKELRSSMGFSQQKLADKLGVLDLIRNKTLTCYNGIPGDGCGHCPACKLRREGLEKYLEIKAEKEKQ